MFNKLTGSGLTKFNTEIVVFSLYFMRIFTVARNNQQMLKMTLCQSHANYIRFIVYI